jgi:glycosyltransferase involved in cell wall biosynthesis
MHGSKLDPPPAHVHLVNPLWDPAGGSDWRTIDTWRLLRGHAEVSLWAEYRPASVFHDQYPIRAIRPLVMRFPRGGTLVFVGTYFRIGHWTRLASFRRVVVLYNTNQPDRLAKNLARLTRAGHHPEVIYTSEALRRLHDGAGHVLQSPIDVERFHPQPGNPAPRPFTVGRLSRDIRSKHHADAAVLWKSLADAGLRVRLMGASCLAAELDGYPGIEILRARSEDPADFLRSLDCFAYRTSDDWFEGYGRVVMEAMATGLPVVVGDRGGYVEHLHDGVNGLVARSTNAMITAVLSLAADRALAARLGSAARRDAVEFNTEILPRRTVALLTTGIARGLPTEDDARVATATG